MTHHRSYPYRDKTPEVTVQSGDTTTPTPQQLNHVGARFLGIVTDTSGKPLKNISVTPYAVGSSTTAWYESDGTRSSGRFKSRAALGVNAMPGAHQATFTVSVTRRAGGSRPSGKVTISLGDVSKTVLVTRGVAKVTLTGLPTGKHTFRLDYQGTSSTTDATKTISTTVR